MFWSKKSISDYERPVSREALIQKGRIAVIDDEEPLLVGHLKQNGFAVDHDRTGGDTRNYDAQIYDVAVVDFHGVGLQLGPAQGLELVRHIRRVSPRTRVIAYTSRSLAANEAEFFRHSHTVLPKDLGLADSTKLIEGELAIALSKQFLFDALLEKLQAVASDRRPEIEKKLVAALSNGDQESFKKYLSKAIGFSAEKAVDVILARLFG